MCLSGYIFVPTHKDPRLLVAEDLLTTTLAKPAIDGLPKLNLVGAPLGVSLVEFLPITYQSKVHATFFAGWGEFIEK